MHAAAAVKGWPAGSFSPDACDTVYWLLQKGLADEFVGVEKPNGEEFHIEETSEERRPFKCVLDVGIVSTTVGASCFL